MRNLQQNYISKDTIYAGLNLLILVDIILIVYLLWFNVSNGLRVLILIFDVALCLILLLDFFTKLQNTDNRLGFFKHNVLFFIASIPFELVFPVYFIAFRFLLLIRIFQLSGVLENYFKGIHRFIENTKLDRVFSWIVFTVIIFTFAIYFLDPSLGLFDSLWYVIVTLTTVGYGDVTPNTRYAKVVSIFLLILGICVFSILTGAVSSYFSDKVLNIHSDAEDELNVLDRKFENMNTQLYDIKQELELARAENRQLQEKIDELLKK